MYEWQNHHDRGQFYSSQRKRTWRQIGLMHLVFILFIGLVGDWKWVVKEFKEDSQKVGISVAAQHQAFVEVCRVQEEIVEKAKNGSLTAEETVKTRNRIIDICNSVKLDHSRHVKFVIDTFRDSFVKNWRPPDSADYVKERCASDPLYREGQARYLAQHQLEEAVGKYPAIKPVSGEQLKKFVCWILRWYYLLSIPTLICLLLEHKFSGYSILEKIYFGWKQLLLTICFGPMGLGFSFISDNVNKTSQYLKLEKAFLKAKPENYQLTQKDQEIIWWRVDRPLMRIEEVIELAKVAVAPKPILAGFLIWLFSLSFSSISLAKCWQPRTETEITLTLSTVEHLPSFLYFSQKIYKELPGKVCLMILDSPMLEENFIRLVNGGQVFLRQICFEKIMPRAPPNRAGRERLLRQKPILLLTAQSRKEKL